MLIQSPTLSSTHEAQLSAFIVSLTDDYASEELSAHDQRVDEPLVPEQGPTVIINVVTIDEATSKIPYLLSRRTSAIYRFNRCALLDTGLPQSFTRGTFELALPTHPTSEPLH